MKVAGHDVTLVDIPGTYKDSPGGPFAGGKTIERPEYRMLAAIVEGPGGSYFLKFYGPASTVETHADGFRKMIESMVPVAN
jgi:gluconolactonase